MLCSAELRRPLVVADPKLSFNDKPPLAKQREYEPDTGAGVGYIVLFARR